MKRGGGQHGVWNEGCWKRILFCFPFCHYICDWMVSINKALASLRVLMAFGGWNMRPFRRHGEEKKVVFGGLTSKSQ